MTSFQSRIFFFVFVVLIALGCKDRSGQNSGSKYRGMDKEEVMKRHDDTRLDFKTISFKGNADFHSEKDNQKIGFSYKINIAKDSLIWASISKMIPVAIILIDRDSVKIRNMIGREAILCDFSFLTGMLGFEVDFGMMQNFLMGDANFLPKMEMISGKNPPIHMRGSMPPYEVSWFLNGSNFKLEKMEVKDRILGKESVLTYGEFQSKGNKLVPMQTLLEVTQPDKVRIELKHSSVEFDKQKTSFSFRIPKSYELKPCKRK